MLARFPFALKKKRREKFESAESPWLIVDILTKIREWEEKRVKKLVVDDNFPLSCESPESWKKTPFFLSFYVSFSLLHFTTLVLLIFPKRNLFYVGTNWVLSVHNNRNSCSLFAHIARLMTAELFRLRPRLFSFHRHTPLPANSMSPPMISNRKT